jgi:hypothetical protein
MDGEGTVSDHNLTLSGPPPLSKTTSPRMSGLVTNQMCPTCAFLGQLHMLIFPRNFVGGNLM